MAKIGMALGMRLWDGTISSARHYRQWSGTKRKFEKVFMARGGKWSLRRDIDLDEGMMGFALLL